MDTGLFEALPDALLIVDAEGNILRANGNAHRMFGYSEGTLIGHVVEQLIPESLRSQHRKHRAVYSAQPRVRPMGAGGMTLVGQRRDGEQFPIEIALAPLQFEGATRFLASVRDVSETLRARQALERARYDRLIAELGQDALQEMSSLALVDRMPERLATALGPDVCIGLWQRNAEQGRAGWTRSSHSSLRGVDAGVIEPHVSHAFRVVGLGENRPGCAVAPLFDRGEPIGALVAWSPSADRFDHDVQHLLQATATLLSSTMQRIRTEAELAHAQRLDSLGQLTGGIAHDFNNLLTVMSGSLQLLASGQEDAKGASALIESALRAVRRGAELTDKLLAFGRRKQLRPTPVDAGRLLHDIQVLLRRTLGEGVELRIRIEPGLRPALADASQLDAALVNLALNARDAMPDGGVITLAVEERWIASAHTVPGLSPGHYLVYSVADTGKGMSPDVATHAIEPFFSTKGGRGSGLGLSMVYGFARQSGGGMQIASVPDEGTHVSLFLPVAPVEDVMPLGTGGLEVQAAPGTALVVEDDDDVRAIAASFLRSLGYEVAAVSNYDAALARLGEDGAGLNVVFSDVMLGSGPDGVALANVVRARWPGIAVVLTSGHALGSRSDSSGFVLLHKPYDRGQLAAALARARRPAATAT